MCLVSVIINCFNGEKFLRETLESLKNQTYQKYELVFIDNCSTDATAKIAKSFDDRLKYYKTDKNIPLGEARNYGLQRCKGEYIAFLDSDDLWDENKLKLQVEVFEKNPETVIVVSNNYVLNMMTNHREICITDAKTGIVEFSKFAINYKYGLSAFMIRKSAIKSMAFYFDTRLSYAEEFDFFLRLAMHGTVFYMSNVLATYRLHEKMHSLKLKESIPVEYDMVANNLIDYQPGFEKKYPNVLRRLCFLRDYTKTKLFIEKKEYKKGRVTIKPYLSYNKKAAFFYVLSFFPGKLIDAVYIKYFTKKIL